MKSNQREESFGFTRLRIELTNSTKKESISSRLAFELTLHEATCQQATKVIIQGKLSIRKELTRESENKYVRPISEGEKL